MFLTELREEAKRRGIPLEQLLKEQVRRSKPADNLDVKR